MRFLVLALLVAACTSSEPPPARDPVEGSAGSGGREAGTGGGGGTEPPSRCNPEDGGVPAPFGLDERPPNPTCIAPPRPSTGAPVRLERAFGGLRFDRPVSMVQEGSRWYVVEKAGRILSFRPGDSQASVVLDIRSKVDSAPDEAGLLALALRNDKAYVHYTASRGGGRLRGTVSSFAFQQDGKTLDPASEKILFTVDPEEDHHHGGQLAFARDGLLYVSLGDGGNGYVAQRPDSLLGKVVRIDPAGGSPEIFATGFRNPWRFSFDRETGEMWVGDVGQALYEEVDRVVEGGNYGWNVREGASCHKDPHCSTDGLVDPVIVYGHDQGQAVTGGYVYRGQAIPSLSGAYVYADFVGGTIWGLFPDEAKPKVLVQSSINPASFAEDADGELYLVDHFGGGIYALVPDGDPEDGFPRKLSETGCFKNGEPAPGLIPYSVNVALWSDGADKERYVAIPDGSTIGIAADGDWDLPVGTVLVKTFRFDCKPVETRLFVRHDDGGWAGYSYEWNEDGTDAVLLAAGKTKDIGSGRTWTYPSRGDCLACHTAAAGRSLGLETAQLNRDIRWPNGRRANVVETYAHIGLFATDPGPASRLPALPDPFGDGTLEDRARSYLHANCSYCHRPDGSGQGSADYRWGQPMGVCGEPPEEGDLGVAEALVIAPGDPAHSLVPLRMRALGEGRMPPIGSAVVHEQGVELIEDWIRSMRSCE